MSAATPHTIVLDANIAIRGLVPNPAREACKEFLQRTVEQEVALTAPSLWLYEVTSALCKLVNLGHLSAQDGRDFQEKLLILPVDVIEPDAELQKLALDWTLRLRRSSAYDSFYLALAETLGAELWTLDQRLVNAANQGWVRLLDTPQL